ncbi:MAG: hypothetical protein EXR69_02520 [Myxococcales bacterium]|nr:hypothetical protein [Myxococcales bacterium]
MRSSTSASKLGAVLPAAALPLLLLGLAAQGLWSVEHEYQVPWDTSFAPDCPGSRVVVLGNSRAGSDVDVNALAAALHLPAGQVASITVPGTSLPTWYALAEHVVFDRGCAPDVLVVYGALLNFVTVVPARFERENLLAGLRGGAERRPEDASGFAPVWTDLRQRAAQVRDRALRGLTATLAGVISGGAGRATLDAAFDAGLAKASTAPRMPRPTEALSSEGMVLATTADETLVDEIVTLAAAHGARVVFVRGPSMSTGSGPGPSEGLFLEPVMAATGERLRRLGGLYIESFSPGLPAESYTDRIHLNAVAAAAYTAELGRRIEESRVLPAASLR